MNASDRSHSTDKPRGHRSLTVAALAGLALILVGVTSTLASPASGVTPTVLARGSFDAFKVMSHPSDDGLFKAEAKAPIDVVVRRHAYEPGGSTGWHAHPYPVFITVVEGRLTFYEYGDKTCTPTVVGPGEGYVDSGRGHIARNETGEPALDVSVIMAPVGAAFRTELEAPSAYCGF